MGCGCSQGAGQPEEAPPDVHPRPEGEGGGEQVSPLVAQRGTPFYEFLEQGHMAVVRSTYFDECLEAGVPIKDRAGIPGEAVIDGKEVVELWEEYGYAFLVIISYPWLARGHPDPQRYHLPRLVQALKAFREYHNRESWTGRKADRVRELGGGVILDFCTFWQGDNRTAEQKRIFKEGLKLINIPYGHRDVTALKLTSTPPSQVRSYDDRGWTHFESTVIDGKAPSERHAYGERNVLTCDDRFQPEGWMDAEALEALGRRLRKPPLTPQRFREELEVRRQRAEAKGEPLFTNGQDSPVILERYDASFGELCHSTKLDYTSMGWGAAEAKELALALPHFTALQTLRLNGNPFNGEAATALAAALPRCPALHTLELRGNSLGNEGGEAAKALATALPHCPALCVLWLNSNNLGNDGEASAELAAALGHCQALEDLYLHSNDLGPEAARALAGALPRCPALRRLNLDANNLGGDCEAFAALAAALGRCLALEKLWLANNSLGPEAAKALAAALSRGLALHELWLGNNNVGIDDEAATALATALPSCPSLRRLNLYGNNLSEEGKAALLAAWRDAKPQGELYT